MQERAPGAELSIAILDSADGAASTSAGRIAALTTALACEYAGFKDVCVYSHDGQTASDTSVELSPNASRILRSLKVLDPLKPHSFEPQFIHQRSYRTGFQLAITALGAMAEGRYNAPFLHAPSGAVEQVLGAAAEARGITTPTAGPLTNITQSELNVELTFESSSKQAGDLLRTHDVLLVTGDSDQKIRTLAKAETLRRSATPLTAWRGTTPHDALPPGAFAAVITQWLGPTQHFSYHFTAGGEVLEFNAIAQTQGQTNAELHTAFDRWHPSINALIRTADTLTPTPVYETEPVERLAHGHIAFTGASCHTVMPHLPQQHALGIEDAWVVARMLEQWEDQPAEGLVEFERYRLPRARRLQTQAAGRAAMFCDLNPLSTWRRNLALTFGSRFLPELAMQKNDWLYGYDAINGFE